MLLSKLLADLEYEVLSGSDDININNLCNDNRIVKDGDVFVCIKGAAFDGHSFVNDVKEKGAACVVVEENVDVEGITVVKVKSTRRALALMSAAYFDYPAKKLKTIGITGTKGKTTTTYMVRNVLENVGIKTGLIGTIETIIGDNHIKANNTTPESFLIQKYFREMVDAGIECVVMEVSSQGLMLDRTAGIMFDFGIFTNLEPDHIGPNEHRDFNHYLQCKAMLFKQCKHAIVNIDDKHTEEILKGATCSVETYGIDNDADFKANNIKLFQKPGKLCVSYDLSGKIDMPIEIHVPGIFSVYNSLCAIAICSHMTDDKDLLLKSLEDIKVKGRVELVDVSKRFVFMIDYAHNAMSLESLLTSLKKYNPKRLVTIFGCGGNRSKDRRFEMGEVSSNLSDFTIVTSDNPRYEKPADIIADIVVGIKRGSGEYTVVEDRKEAIKYAIENAQDGDVIILAGKGHEDYQEIEGVKYPMDERSLINEVISDEKIKALL